MSSKKIGSPAPLPDLHTDAVLPEGFTWDDVRELRHHKGKRIAFNAGKSRLIGVLTEFDDVNLRLRIRVDGNKETGIHVLRLGRMGNYALLD